MAGMARPTSLTAERRDVIERALAGGAPLSVAAASAGVSARTVSRWLGEGLLVRRALAAVPGPESETPDDPARWDDEAVQRALVRAVLQAAQHDWRAASWLLRQRWPNRYGR
jgi:hypothetical protein